MYRGTVIPPIVIGVKLDDKSFSQLEEDIEKNVLSIFKELNIEEQISIIDGMQRTTALYEALSLPKFNKDRSIRMELWIAKPYNIQFGLQFPTTGMTLCTSE